MSGEIIALPTSAKHNPNSAPPNFIVPTSINDMDDVHLDAWLDTIRTQRLVAQHRFNDSKRLRNAAEHGKLSLRYEKVMHKMAVDLEKFEKFVEKFEKSVNDLRALRLQLGEGPL